jgi:hypothetical protein
MQNAKASLLHAIGLSLGLLIAAPSRAQPVTENPKSVTLSKEKAELIFRSACQVVAEELKIRNTDTAFQLTLVMGDGDPRYTSNDELNSYKIYLKEWDEPLFASSAMMLALHRVIPPRT